MASCMQQLYMMPQARAAILNSRVSFINPLHPNIGVHILYTFPNTKTKLPTAQENAGHQVVIDFKFCILIAWKSGVTLLDQSQDEVKQSRSNSGLPSTPNWKLLN